MKPTKIKLCPFCGEQPLLIEFYNIQCLNPECPIKPKTTTIYKRDIKRKALKEWNDRV